MPVDAGSVDSCLVGPTQAGVVDMRGCRPLPRPSPRSMGGVTSQLSHEASHGQSAAIIAIASPLLAGCMHGACAVSFKLAGTENAASIVAGRN